MEGFPGGAIGKEPACQCKKEMRVQSLGWKDTLEEGMATHSSILAWIKQCSELCRQKDNLCFSNSFWLINFVHNTIV